VTKAYDAIVVGGGIVGCACAFYLSEHFKKVLLIEKGPIGGGSTAAGMGHVVAMDDSPAQFRLTKYSQDLWNGLYPQLDANCEPRFTGTMWVATDEEEFAHVGDKKQSYASYGVRTEILDSQSLADAEPSLRKGLAGGLLVPSDSVIYPMTAASWMLNHAIQRGATLIQGKAVVSMGNEQVSLADGTLLTAKHLVNATGDRAASLTHGLPIEPRKGHLLITDRYPGMVRHQLIELGYLKSAHEMSSESVAFNAQPRATGQVLLGSSRQFVGWNPEIDRKLISKMVKRAEDYLPEIGKLSLGIHAHTQIVILAVSEQGIFLVDRVALGTIALRRVLEKRQAAHRGRRERFLVAAELIPVKRRVARDHSPLKTGNGQLDLLKSNRPRPEGLFKQLRVLSVRVQLLDRLRMRKIHLHRIGNRSRSLFLKARRPAVPKLDRIVRRVDHRRSRPTAEFPADTGRYGRSVRKSVRGRVTTGAGNRVIRRKLGVIIQLFSQRNGVGRGLVSVGNRHRRQPQRNRNVNRRADRNGLLRGYCRSLLWPAAGGKRGNKKKKQSQLRHDGLESLRRFHLAVFYRTGLFIVSAPAVPCPGGTASLYLFRCL